MSTSEDLQLYGYTPEGEWVPLAVTADGHLRGWALPPLCAGASGHPNCPGWQRERFGVLPQVEVTLLPGQRYQLLFSPLAVVPSDWVLRLIFGGAPRRGDHIWVQLEFTDVPPPLLICETRFGDVVLGGPLSSAWWLEPLRFLFLGHYPSPLGNDQIPYWIFDHV